MLRRYLKFIVVVFWIISVPQIVAAQELITATPVRIRIPTQDANAPAVQFDVTPTVTRTPTQTAIMLEAKADAGEVNVRAEPDIEADLLGTIRAGEFYPVLGRYFRWIQFQFDTSPSGRGWVFDELVTITGDISSIPDLSEAPLPTEDTAAVAATETQVALTQTPGGILTLTAESRVLPVPGQVTQASNVEEPETSVLPTFTYPPDIAAAAPTEITTTPTTSPEEPPFTVPNNVPPVVPIVLLGAGGLLGLVVSSLRR